MSSTRRGKGSDVKGFFRQTKKNSGISKPNPKSSKSSPKPSLTLASEIAQSPALVSHAALHLNDVYDSKEESLRQFDMNMAYGPCVGLSRLGRWERAQRMGLNPPKDIEGLLREPKVSRECLWDGRV